MLDTRDLEWIEARYPDEDFVRGEYRDIGGALGTRAIGANIHRLRPGDENARYHAHELEEELFYVLEGRPVLRLEGRTFRLSPGHVVLCPPRAAHTFRNEGSEDCSILMTSTRCGRPDAVYPPWKAEQRGIEEEVRDLDPRDPRVRHSAEMSWQDDPKGRNWGGSRHLTGDSDLQLLRADLHLLRGGALLPYRAETSSETLLLLLQGELELLLDGEATTLVEGAAARAAPGRPWAVRSRTPRQARIFVLRDAPPSNRREHPTAPKGWEEPILL